MCCKVCHPARTAVLCQDRELRPQVCAAKRVERMTSKAFARNPGGTTSRGFLFLAHGSGSPFDQRSKRRGWNQGSFPDFAGLQATLFDQAVKSGLANARNLAGIGNGIRQRLGWSICSSHQLGSVRSRRNGTVCRRALGLRHRWKISTFVRFCSSHWHCLAVTFSQSPLLPFK